MAREQIDFRGDFKLEQTFYDKNPAYDPEQPIGVGNEEYIMVDPTTVPFVINLFSLKTNSNEELVRNDSTLFQATWDLTTATNFEFIDNNTKVLVIFNNDPTLRAANKGLFQIGQLQGTTWFGYPDSQMPDDTFNCGVPFDTNVDIINIDNVTEYEPINV